MAVDAGDVRGLAAVSAFGGSDGSWDFRISAYRGGELRFETVHRGVSSMQMELDIFKARMAKGHFDRIVVADLRPAWRRELQPEPWRKDFTEVIGRPLRSLADRDRWV